MTLPQSEIPQLHKTLGEITAEQYQKMQAGSFFRLAPQIPATLLRSTDDEPGTRVIDLGGIVVRPCPAIHPVFTVLPMGYPATVVPLAAGTVCVPLALMLPLTVDCPVPAG